MNSPPVVYDTQIYPAAGVGGGYESEDSDWDLRDPEDEPESTPTGGSAVPEIKQVTFLDLGHGLAELLRSACKI